MVQVNSRKLTSKKKYSYAVKKQFGTQRIGRGGSCFQDFARDNITWEQIKKLLRGTYEDPVKTIGGQLLLIRINRGDMV